MATITSFSTLKTELAGMLHRSDLTSDLPLFIQLGELRIYRDLRIRAMETALSSAIASGVIAVPSGYVDLKFAYINGAPVRTLEKKDAEWIYYNYPTRSADSTPNYIAREADNFIFGPYPDSAYTVKGIYWKKLTALSTDNETNWFTSNAPDLLLFASLCEAAPWIQEDARIPIWENKYALIRDRIQREDDREEFGGGPISMTLR